VNLELTDDQEFFRETTRRFIESESPISTVRTLAESEHGFDRGWWHQAAELGWTAMFAAERVGGGSLSGRPLSDAVIIAEEIGRMVTPGPFLPVNVVSAALSRADNGAHDDVLGGLLSGEVVAAWAFAEQGNRWDASGVGATAEIDADAVVLSGKKRFVEAAACADEFLVVGRTGDGLTQVLVPARTPGVVVTPARSLDLTKRFGDVSLHQVRLPLTSVVGDVGAAAADVEHQLELALAIQTAETVGGLDRVFGSTLEYMGDRFAFGRPIASYQALKHRVADLLLALETAKGCVDAAVRAFDDAADSAAVEASVTKAYVGDVSMHLLQECMQFLGGISVTWEHDIHLYLRRATVNRAVLGTPEQHRERICALLNI
jgi:alkylation response protein AidB-like acyl-CoA dehydrogenase